jgi:hypothetical protein
MNLFALTFTNVPSGTWIRLAVILVVLVLNFSATTQIISKAGYPRAWILVPFAPFALTVACFVILIHDVDAVVYGGAFGIEGVNTIGLMWHIDLISIAASWLFFLVFAFAPWPGARSSGETRIDTTYRGPIVAPVESSVAPVASSRRSSARSSRQEARGTTQTQERPTEQLTAPAPAASAAKSKYCVWCAEPLPGSRAMFHNCGPKDRPAVFCRNCATALPEGSTTCPSCGAAA